MLFTAQEEKPWEGRPAFQALSAEGDVPLLRLADERVLAEAQAISEYLEESQPEPALLFGDAALRAEIRRLVSWFTRRFYAEVTVPIAGEKLFRRLRGLGAPEAGTLRAGIAALRTHLSYLGSLAEARGFLAADRFSLADVAAAAQLSVLDYAGDVPWEAFEPAKTWYARVKSRPAFRALLADHVAGLPPAAHYADLDF